MCLTMCPQNRVQSNGKTLRKTDNRRDVTNPNNIMNKVLKKAYNSSPEIKWTQCINKSFALKAYEELIEIIYLIYNEIKEQNSRDFIKFPKAIDLQHPEYPTPCVSSAIYKGKE